MPDQPTSENNPPPKVEAAETQPYSLKSLPADIALPPQVLNRPVALILCHGMGQQTRHETLAQAAGNLHKSTKQRPAENRPPAASSLVPPATMRYVRFTDADRSGKSELLLPRAEIEVDVPGHGGRVRQQVHVYEVYWAPLTEGQIGLAEVVRFLLASGFSGLRNAFNTFPRWLFEQEVKLPVGRGTFPALFGLLLLILALVLINTLMTLVLGENLLNTAGMQHTSPALVDALTGHLARLLGMGVLILLALKLRAGNSRSLKRRLVVGLVWALLGAASGLLLYSVGAMAFDYFALRNTHAQQADNLGLSWRGAWIGAVWLVAGGVSWRCREFLVQYLGDVVIYVDAYSVDRFFGIRNRIRRLARRTLEAVYGAREDGGSEALRYARVVVAGHSLGSLVAYDALNALLLADEAVNSGLHVRDRTPALITYGSPLDKTTFLFHAKPHVRRMHTALDAARQPLIRDRAVRQAVQWVNLHAPADIVSAKLNYFNEPPTSPAPVLAPDVLNINDPDSYIPVLAHTQYWWGGTLSLMVRQALCGQHISGAPGRR